MVGFKTIALLLSLLVFAACVPQTKQTECGSNEAFNAALRTCVPVVNGPSSFISIDSFLPTSSLTKYKNDTTPITLSIVISNPYAQTYTVEWERIFSGVPVSISPTSPTSYSFAPSYLATEVGTHIISVKIKDTSNNIVDSHSFEVKINDNPKPIIQSSTVTPALYASTYTPSTVPQNFSFTVKNNGATMTGAGYRTDWKLYRAGVLIDSETDTFPTSSPAGSLSSSGSNYPVYAFDPFLVDGTAIGAYTIIARVTNTAAEVVAEQQWSATVAHPSLSKITNRDIYTSGSSPSFATSTIAFNGVAYTGSPTYNFIPSTVTTPAAGVQGDYCVTVTSGEGTYTGDSQFVRVDYYLDGGTLVYSGLTTAVDNKVCLTDAAVATLNATVFSNSTSTSTQTHTLVARVVDEAIGQEYASSDMNASLGTYPVTWNFTVKPQNQAPSVSFGSLTTLSCPTTSGSTKSGCTVSSDTPFTVRINLASDDFYTLPANEANFGYSIRLYQNGVQIQSCDKTGSDPGYTGVTDANGADGYECVFSIESYNGSGPINLNSYTYSIQAEISDTGSPIAATPATSSTLNWNFATSGVTESNLAVMTIPSWSVSGAVTEGATINFAADITDPQRDNHTYAIKYCTNVLCTTSTTLTSGSITRTSNAATYSLSVPYTLPEDFLLGITSAGLDCHTKKRGETCAIQFFITVNDVPNTATPGTVSSSTATSTITNYNGPLSVNTAFSNPVPSSFTALTTFAFVGHPISISNNPASILTDTSAVTSEKTFRYQWFVKNATSVTTYTAIEGATGNNLIWTPSLIKESNVATDYALSFMLCVEDQPTSAIASVSLAESICSNATPWVVTVVNNVAKAHVLSAAPSSTDLATSALAGQYGTETAIWYEQTPSAFTPISTTASYIAMIGNDQRIHIKKVLVKDRTKMDINNNVGNEIISFYPIPSGVVAEVRDLSITGTANELYIAYLASSTGSPASFYPQVRRIDISSGKLSPNSHTGKFGFDYDGLGFTNSCSPAGDCPTTAASGITTISFSPSGASITGSFIIVTPNGNFAVDFGTYDAIDTICSTCTGSQMATNLADIINASTNPLLAGYSAIAAGSTVSIAGATAGDYFDASTDTNSRISGRLGKIYVTSGGSWYLPFVNKALGGSYTDKLSVYTASTGSHMSAFSEGLLDPFNTAGLGLMDSATKFDNYLEGANLWIAMVSQTGSAGKLYKVDPTTFALVDSDTIFTGEALLDVQVAASTTRVYVGVTAAIGNELKLGIYDNNGAVQSEFDMNDAAHLDAASDTDDYFNTASISSYRIVPYGTEARLFAISKGATVSNYKLFMARLRTVSSTWTLSCGDCQTVSELGQDLSGFVSLGVAPIRDNPSSLYRLGSDGSVNGQGLKDVAFVSFGRLDTASASICDPAIGVFNVEGEAIGSSTVYNGPVLSEDAGLYRGPFVKN